MITRLTLPEAFGTATIHGMLYKMVETHKNPMDSLAHIIGNTHLIVSIGFRDIKDLDFIVYEAKSFIEWCERNFGLKPHMDFI